MEPTDINGNLNINPLFDRKQRWIWTADPYNALSAWVVDFGGGGCKNNGFKGDFYVRAVR